MKTQGESCRAAAGICDVEEQCDGSNALCPGDGKKGPGTTCRAAADECDAAESCDGASDDCPDDALLAAGTICRQADDECDLDEQCDGVTASCPDDATKPDGAECFSGLGICADGTCMPNDEGSSGGSAGAGGGSAAAGGGGSGSATQLIVSNCGCVIAGLPSPSRVHVMWWLLAVGVARRRRRSRRGFRGNPSWIERLDRFGCAFNFPRGGAG